MTDPTALDDQFLPLAFALHSTPGAYAVLAGAGVSLGAGLPSAWGIVVELVNQIAQLEDPNHPELDEETAGPWYEERFKKEPAYSELLEQLAPTPHQREALLRGFFESRDEDTEQRPGPSKAHTAVAAMMASGTIKVIVTLNFDRLFETALRQLQIEPVVIATDADAEGMAPLHTIDHCVIHLHGDYRSAASMLNTTKELKVYRPHMQRLLEQVVRDYGLIVAGWSVTYDVALKETIAAHHRPRFTMGWIDPSPLRDAARELVSAKDAQVLPTTADNALGRLADQVTALRERRARHPATLTVATSRIKRQLAGQRPAIAAHDMVAAEMGTLVDHPALVMRRYQSGDGDSYERRFDQLAEASRTPAGCVAALAYWGDDTTDQWWVPELERFAQTPRVSGMTSYIELPYVVGTRLLYAAGVAATAARRYALVDRALSVPAHRLASTKPQTLNSILDWSRVHTYLPKESPGRRPSVIVDIVSEALGLHRTRVDDAWQTFEVLRILTPILADESFASDAIHYQSRTSLIKTANAAGQPEVAQQAAKDRDDVLQKMTASCDVYRPHVWMVDSFSGDDRLVSPCVERLTRDVSALRELTPHLTNVDGETALTAALAAVGKLLANQASDRRHDFFPTNGAAFIPSEFWLDDTPAPTA